jgi:hypothetical protein
MYRENTGKCSDFRADPRIQPAKTTAAIDAFSVNSLGSGTENYFRNAGKVSAATGN